MMSLSLWFFVCLTVCRVCFCEQEFHVEPLLENGGSLFLKGESEESFMEVDNHLDLNFQLLNGERNKRSPGCTQGTCLSQARETRCQRERRKAQERSKKRDTFYLHIPTCRVDGSFQEIQCHDLMGYCWCVSGEGKPLPKSSAFGRDKIRCDGLKLKGCHHNKRKDFSTNLMNFFKEEYSRQQGITNSSNSNANSNNNSNNNNNYSNSNNFPLRRVAEWKFRELDRNNDSFLLPQEIQFLKVMAMKVVKPSSCAGNFPVICDGNEDGQIALEEWMGCLGASVQEEEASEPQKRKRRLEHNLRHEERPIASLQSWAVDAGHKRRQKHKSKEDSEEPSILDLMIRSGEYHKVTVNKEQNGKKGKHRKQKSWDRGKSTKERKRVVQSEKSLLTSEPNKDSGDCFSERQKAAQLDRDNPRGHIFVPTCDPLTGLYARAQCHTSTRYCWCVDQKTGIAIPGVATQNATPNCEEISLLSRTMPGCSPHLKKKLLIHLVSRMTQQMENFVSNSSSMRISDQSESSRPADERAIRWKFQLLDANHDSVLTRAEMKSFRAEMREMLSNNEKLMSRCGRKLLHFCDEDEDDDVSLKEWITCFGLNIENSKQPTNASKRLGKNPFTTFLT